MLLIALGFLASTLGLLIATALETVRHTLGHLFGRDA